MCSEFKIEVQLHATSPTSLPPTSYVSPYIQPFVEPECSLPCSQQPTPDIYPEPHKSSTHPLTLFHSDPCQYLLPPSPDLPHGLFLQVFRPKFHTMSRLSYACFIPRSSLSNNVQNKFKILKSSPYAVLSASYHFLLHRSKSSPQHIVRKHPQIMLYSQCYRPRYIQRAQLYFFIF